MQSASSEDVGEIRYHEIETEDVIQNTYQQKPPFFRSQFSNPNVLTAGVRPFAITVSNVLPEYTSTMTKYLASSARDKPVQVTPTDTNTQPHTSPTGPPPLIPCAREATQPSHLTMLDVWDHLVFSENDLQLH
jgi:hypothetical protein